MKERLINIFAYGDETHVHAIGWRVYEREGTAEFTVSAAIPHFHAPGWLPTSGP